MDNVITQEHADKNPAFAGRVGQTLSADELAATKATPRPEKVS